MENGAINEEKIPDFVNFDKNTSESAKKEDSKGFEASGFKLFQMKLDDLATLAKPYAPSKSHDTLVKMGKKKLIAIIQAKSDNTQEVNNVSNNINNLENLVKSFLQACDEFKKERDKEPNNTALKATIENNVHPAFGNGAIASVDSTFVARIIVICGLLYIATDSFFGIKNVVNAYKNYLSKKKASKAKESANAS
ncbi:hypothetical protein BKH41_00685 [Helicobacter sp. 12S02232-10]|uniref:hypothetical protein n=1 Tax=Helicobacter sp. 12S02232-10 TaxID=1476197 RepID=UPI000BA72AA1|nr:hypothetical protein [Helicobacter sp. 12S02232-10]PAF49851.1 hypothetical protein BKH41_00685 [Helicobacter sp. 12S02232-10]